MSTRNDDSKKGASAPKKYKVAFVCAGNTCRSPMAQFIFKRELKKYGVNNFTVRSFGLTANGKPMNENAQLALKALKIPFTKTFVSKRPPSKVSSYEAIICMESSQKTYFSGKAPSVYTLGELCGFGDVADPYGRGYDAYLETAKLLLKACDYLAENLKSSLAETGDED